MAVEVTATPGFRDLMSLYPTGVAVVTTADELGQPFGMTCSSLASVCLFPPTLLVCLRTTSATCRAVEARGAFAVNLLPADGRDLAELFSSAVPDRFGRARWRPSAAGLPWLVPDAVALADCDVVRTEAVGDHTVFFGEARDIEVRERPPLLYGMRRYLRAAHEHRS